MLHSFSFMHVHKHTFCGYTSAGTVFEYAVNVELQSLEWWLLYNENGTFIFDFIVSYPIKIFDKWLLKAK